jgi:hypothetical protein
VGGSFPREQSKNVFTNLRLSRLSISLLIAIEYLGQNDDFCVLQFIVKQPV